MSLQPCSRCHRHVRVDAAGCPFCGAHVAAIAAAPSRRIAGPLSRAAVFAGLTGCWSGSTTPTQPPAPGSASVPADAQTADAPSSDIVQRPGTAGVLEGVVRDKWTNNPLPNVTVQLRDQNGLVGAVNTNERGAYRFDGVAPGDYQLVVQFHTSDSGGSAQHPVTIVPTGSRVDVALPTYHRAPSPKPYGAPPARRRIV